MRSLTVCVITLLTVSKPILIITAKTLGKQIIHHVSLIHVVLQQYGFLPDLIKNYR